MYCPNCKQEFPGKFCPECGAKLIEKPEEQEFALNISDNAAVVGGVNVTRNDSYNTTNYDQRTIYNVANNVSKSADELKLERTQQFMECCKQAFSDGILSTEEQIFLENERIRLGIDENVAAHLIEKARKTAGRLTTLSLADTITLKNINRHVDNNNVAMLKGQMQRLTALVGNYNADEVFYAYYMLLAALNPAELILDYERNDTDEYWQTFWVAVAYMKYGKSIETENTIGKLNRFREYPEDNTLLLLTLSTYTDCGVEEASDYINSLVPERCSLLLKQFIHALFIEIAPERAAEVSDNKEKYKFYFENIISLENPEARRKAEEEAKKQAEEEARKKAEAEARRKAEEEAEKEAEAKARRKAEEEEKKKALGLLIACVKKNAETEEQYVVAKVKELLEEEARFKAAEAKKRAEAEARRKAEEEAKKQAEAEARRKAAEIEKKAEAEARRKAEKLLIACISNSDSLLHYFTADEWNANKAKSSYSKLGVLLRDNGREFIIAANDCVDSKGKKEFKFGAYGKDIDDVQNHTDKKKLDDIWTGKKDTCAIIEQTMLEKDGIGIWGAPAAEVAWNYKACSNDPLQWYLPSISELLLIGKNRAMINDFLEKHLGGEKIKGGFFSSGYWSSTLVNLKSSWYVFMNTGSPLDSSRAGTNMVRAVCCPDVSSEK